MSFTLLLPLMQGAIASQALAEDAPPIQVTWDSEELDKKVFRNSIRSKSKNPLKDAVLTTYMIQMVKKEPTITQSTLMSRVAALSIQLDEKLKHEVQTQDFAKAWSKVLAMSSPIPGWSNAATVLKETWDSVANDAATFDSWRNTVSSGMETARRMKKFSLGVEAESYRIVRFEGLNRPNSAFVQTWNGMIGGPAGVDATWTFEELTDDPMYALLQIDQIVAKQENGQALLEQLNQTMQTVLAEVRQTNAQASADITNITNNYPPATPNQPVPSEVQQQAQALADQRSKDIAALAGVFDVLSTLTGFVDPDAARIVSGVGQASVQIAKSINDFLPMVASMGLDKALFSMGGAALTGNIVGAISGLLPLFSAGGPSPEQMILEELGKLRDDVSKLHNAMDAHFAHVDEKLNVIYTDMVKLFDDVLDLVQANSAQLTALQNSLSELTNKVNAWGAEIMKALGNSTMSPSRQAMDTYLDYKAKFGQPIPDYQTYIDKAEGPLHFAATTLVRESPLVLPSSSYGNYDNDPLSALDMYSEEGDKAGGATGFMSWYGNRHYGWPATVSSAPNKSAWLTAANGYWILESQNMGYAKNINTGRAAQVATAGQDINKAAAAMSKPLPEARADGTRVNPLFKGLVEDYKTAASTLSQQLVPIQKEFTGEKEYKLFGSADQALSPAATPADASTLQHCRLATQPSIARPVNASVSSILPQLSLAQYAMSGTDKNRPVSKVCYDSHFINVEQGQSGPWIITTADISVSINTEVRWANGERQTYRTHTAMFEVGEVCRERYDGTAGGACYSVGDVLNQRWSTWKPQFETSAHYSENEAELNKALTTVRGKMTQFLAGQQKAYLDKVVHQLQTVGTPLHTANAKLTKQFRLLQEFSEVGWATAISKDDRMRMVLKGAERLPADVSGDSSITNIFRKAQANYAACAPVDGPGSACTSTTKFNPMAGHTYQWMVRCLPWASKFEVPANQITADPVGNTILGFALWGANFLGERFEQHSKQLAQGTYTEGFPEVDRTISLIQGMDAAAHLPAA
jgi:hypothetical protein